MDPKINGIIGLNAAAGAVLGVSLWHALMRPCVLMQSAALQGEKNYALYRKLFFCLSKIFFRIAGAVIAAALPLCPAQLSTILN